MKGHLFHFSRGQIWILEARGIPVATLDQPPIRLFLHVGLELGVVG